MTREEAICELSVIWERLSHPEDCENGCYSFRDGNYTEALDMAIESLSERNKGDKGEWIKATGMMPPEFHGHHCCSECGNFANMEPPFGNREGLSKFCPNCGAIMIGGED